MENRSQVGGILSIVSGAFGVLWMFWFIFITYFFRLMVTDFNHYAFQSSEDELALNLVTYIYGGIGVVLAILGVLAIVGGVYALKKKLWGLALAGAIAGTITFLPCGITAVIFTSLGQPEFKAPKPQVPTD